MGGWVLTLIDQFATSLTFMQETVIQKNIYITRKCFCGFKEFADVFAYVFNVFAECF